MVCCRAVVMAPRDFFDVIVTFEERVMEQVLEGEDAQGSSRLPACPEGRQASMP